ncbi:MAG: cyclic pyranopterin monophosphate synthase MoaC [Candidatus Eisenbacteria bacterium]
MTSKRLRHVGTAGAARMVDVSSKRATARSARAEAVVLLGDAVARLLDRTGGVAKGNVLETARIAAIQAAKRTSELIPLCHPLAIDRIDVGAERIGERVRIVVEVACHGRTGAEMEAMTAAAVGALTVYDMCKSAAKGIEIESVRLLEKRGGKSGTWKRAKRRGGE